MLSSVIEIYGCHIDNIDAAGGNVCCHIGGLQCHRWRRGGHCDDPCISISIIDAYGVRIFLIPVYTLKLRKLGVVWHPCSVVS